MWPVCMEAKHLSEFLNFPLAPLSLRAAEGFKSRMDVSALHFQEEFRKDMARYVKRGLRAAVA